MAAVALVSLGQANAASKPWQELDNCILLPNESNDGDSFHIRWENQEFVFRIYFTDCPEADLTYRDRVEAQAAYFGISVEDAVRVGRMASDFTREFLTQPFVIKTRWQYALGRSKLGRKYGFVSVGGQDLAEALVANGLARIHGVGVSGLSTQEVSRLKGLEETAKAKGLGAWGIRGHAMKETAASAN